MLPITMHYKNKRGGAPCQKKARREAALQERNRGSTKGVPTFTLCFHTRARRRGKIRFSAIPDAFQQARDVH
jgi:hypothetical protein